jgi:hypothetical protein
MDLLTEQIPKESPEPGYLPIINADGLIWIALQNCVSAPIWGRHTDSFGSCVRIIMGMIQKWAKTDDVYSNRIKENAEGKSPDPIIYFWAIWDLLERNHFFERQDKVDLIG